MVQATATFMDACYIACRNAITATALEHFHECVERFHKLRNIFIEADVQDSILLPCQHAFSHFYHSIQLFSSLNGLCSSITGSKHIKAVKEPWHQSSDTRRSFKCSVFLYEWKKWLCCTRYSWIVECWSVQHHHIWLALRRIIKDHLALQILSTILKTMRMEMMVDQFQVVPQACCLL